MERLTGLVDKDSEGGEDKLYSHPTLWVSLEGIINDILYGSSR